MGSRFGGGARAALVGGLLGVVWVVAAVPASDGVCRAGESGADDGGWGCLGAGIIFGPAAAVVGGLLAWALLALLRVPRASRTAGAGFGVCLMLLWTQDYMGPFLRLFGGLIDDALLLTAGYGLAHVLVAAGTQRNVRLGVALALLAAWPLALAEHASAVSDAARDRLDSAGVPLLAPDVPGYRPHFPMLTGVEKDFQFFELSTGTSTAANDRDKHGVWLTVQHLPPAFAPPDHCYANDGGASVVLSPCTPVTANVWRVQRNDTRWYVVRPTGRNLMVLMRTDGTAVPEKDILAMAADLHTRKADFFGDGG